MSGWNTVSDLMLSFRFPSRLNSVAAGLGRVVGPRIREQMVEARREIQAKQAEAEEKARKEAAPFGTNEDGTLDVFRSENYERTRSA